MNTLTLITLYMAMVTALLFLGYCLAHRNWVSIQNIVDQGVTEESTVLVRDAYMADKLRRQMFFNLDLSFTILVVVWILSIINAIFKFI